jgi:hypothetical protein
MECPCPRREKERGETKKDRYYSAPLLAENGDSFVFRDKWNSPFLSCYRLIAAIIHALLLYLWSLFVSAIANN